MDRIGRYKIVRELGRGAMGVVYHAIDPNIGRPVAIKTIRFGEFRKPEEQGRLRDRLMREARSAGMLSHPGIVTIYDVEHQDDVAYIAMEYVDGPTLDQLLASGKPLPPEQTLSILAQTAAALDYAHQKSIVHRDIKPANIMIAAGDNVKITDFGIAKISATDQFTATGAIVGTPHYMSPEQVQGLAVDGRSDQFSLAVIAYEMLTGEKPFTGEHLTTVVYKIVAEDPIPPHRLNPSLSGAIENVLRKGLSKKPEGRYRSCQEFANFLEKACAATQGWKALGRGASLLAPTLAGTTKPRITLPPARNPRWDAAMAERDSSGRSSFVTFLIGILLVTGALAFIGRQAGPWLSKIAHVDAEVQLPQAPPPKYAPPEPVKSIAPVQSEQKNSPVQVEQGLSRLPDKPSLVPTAESQPAIRTASTQAERVKKQSAPKRIARPVVLAQAISITSSPGGATATLDARPDASCTTPCSLDALPGRHSISITMPGYQIEYREVEVDSGPIELAPVVLRAPAGTLMLTSIPQGASISINGRKLSQVTPAQIALAPGTYRITVEKDGKQSTEPVEIQNGKFNYLRIPIGQ